MSTVYIRVMGTLVRNIHSYVSLVRGEGGGRGGECAW